MDFESAEKILRIVKESKPIENGKVIQQLVQNALQGHIESYRANYFNSNFYYFESLKYAQKIDSPFYLTEIYHSLAINFRQSGEVKRALENYKKAIRYCSKTNNPKKMARLYNDNGIAYLYVSQLDSARSLFEKSFFLYDSLDSNLGRSYYYSHIADIELKKQNYIASLAAYKKGDELLNNLEEASHFGLKAQSNLRLADIYFEMSEFDNSKKHAEIALTFAKETKHKNLMLDAYNRLANIYHTQGKFTDENNALNKIISVEREINKQDQELKVQAAKNGYNFNIQLEQNKLQEAELELKQKRIVWLITMLILFLLFSGVILYQYKKLSEKSSIIEQQSKSLDELNKSLELRIFKRTEELSQKNTELTLKNKEVQSALLKGKILERTRLASDIHDNLAGYITAVKWSFSAINTDKLSSGEAEVFQKVKVMISEAYTNVRNLSHNLMPKEFIKQGLIKSLEKLFENLNANPKIVFTFNSDQDLEMNDEVSFELYSIILEIVNNILKHSDCNRVEFSISIQNDFIILSFIDNGSSYEINGDGFGSQSINKRLEKLSGYSTLSQTNTHSGQNLNNCKIKIPVI